MISNALFRLFSVQFFLFLACALAVIFSLPHRFRIFSLFVLSSIFIALIHWSFLLVAYLCAFVNYSGGNKLTAQITIANIGIGPANPLIWV
jgi:hypothetical protein